MPHQLYDLDCSRTALDMGATMDVVVKMNQSNWLLHGAVPVVARRLTKKIVTTQVPQRRSTRPEISI